METNPAGDGDPRELARVVERVEGAGPAIHESAEVAVGARHGRRVRRPEKGDGRAATLPLLRPAPRAFDRLRGVGRLDPGRAAGATAEPVPPDEVEDDVRRSARETPETLAALAAEQSLKLVRIMLQPRDDLAAVAAGSAPARTMGVEHDDLADARLGEVQRRRQPEIAGPDHEHVRLDVGVERRGVRGRDRGRLLPQVGVPAPRHGVSSSGA